MVNSSIRFALPLGKSLRESYYRRKGQSGGGRIDGFHSISVMENEGSAGFTFGSTAYGFQRALFPQSCLIHPFDLMKCNPKAPKNDRFKKQFLPQKTFENPSPCLYIPSHAKMVSRIETFSYKPVNCWYFLSSTGDRVHYDHLHAPILDASEHRHMRCTFGHRPR